MTTDELVQLLERLGKERDRVNAQRQAVLAELRTAIRQAHAAGVGPSLIARSAGLSRQAVRLALQD